MLMKKLYRDFMVIAQQQTVNATEAAKLEAEDPIVDTDFPNYGKATALMKASIFISLQRLLPQNHCKKADRQSGSPPATPRWPLPFSDASPRMTG